MRAFFSMVERRKKLHRDTIETTRQNDQRFLVPMIPMASTVEKMGLHREPLLVFDGRTPAAVAYRELWDDASRLLWDAA